MFRVSIKITPSNYTHVLHFAFANPPPFMTMWFGHWLFVCVCWEMLLQHPHALKLLKPGRQRGSLILLTLHRPIAIVIFFHCEPTSSLRRTAPCYESFTQQRSAIFNQKGMTAEHCERWQIRSSLTLRHLMLYSSRSAGETLLLLPFTQKIADLPASQTYIFIL